MFSAEEKELEDLEKLLNETKSIKLYEDIPRATGDTIEEEHDEDGDYNEGSKGEESKPHVHNIEKEAKDSHHQFVKNRLHNDTSEHRDGDDSDEKRSVKSGRPTDKKPPPPKPVSRQGPGLGALPPSRNPNTKRAPLQQKQQSIVDNNDDVNDGISNREVIVQSPTKEIQSTSTSISNHRPITTVHKSQPSFDSQHLTSVKHSIDPPVHDIVHEKDHMHLSTYVDMVEKIVSQQSIIDDKTDTLCKYIYRLKGMEDREKKMEEAHRIEMEEREGVYREARERETRDREEREARRREEWERLVEGLGRVSEVYETSGERVREEVGRWMEVVSREEEERRGRSEEMDRLIEQVVCMVDKDMRMMERESYDSLLERVREELEPEDTASYYDTEVRRIIEESREREERVRYVVDGGRREERVEGGSVYSGQAERGVGGVHKYTKSQKVSHTSERSKGGERKEVGGYVTDGGVMEKEEGYYEGGEDNMSYKSKTSMKSRRDIFKKSGKVGVEVYGEKGVIRSMVKQAVKKVVPRIRPIDEVGLGPETPRRDYEETRSNFETEMGRSEQGISEQDAMEVRSNFETPSVPNEGRTMTTERSVKNLKAMNGSFVPAKISMVKRQVSAKVKAGFPDSN